VEALRTPAGERLLAEVAARGTGDDTLLGTVAALRSRHDPALVAAAVTQVRLRARARVKFGADADRMFFTADGLEQATRADVAARHAARYVSAGAGKPARVLDLCCGIGGDLVAFARAGLAVTGVDRDPATAAVARANLAALGLPGTVLVREAAVEPGWPAAWVDPSRRAGGRRVFDPRAYSPPLSFVAELAAAVPLTGAKVAPGIPHEAVTGLVSGAGVPLDIEAEWVSVGGEVKEAALWFGPLATAGRRATLLPARPGPAATLVDTGAGRPPVGPPGEWLYEPDGAVIRAGLVGEVAAALPGGRLLDPTIAYVAADGPVPTPYARGWRVTDVLPFSVGRLRGLLRARGTGRVTVKKRCPPANPAPLRRQLRLPGSGPEAVVVLTRVAGAPTVLVCEPVSPAAAAPSPGTPSGG
jgi:SAM-dependent methyltransferase